MLDAKRRVEKSRLINNQIFAYYRVRPIRMRKHKPNPSSFKVNQEHLARISPWLPKHVPHWMRAAI
jgi:hypothetical protein